MEKEINLLALHGKAGAGKDTVGKIIQYLTTHKETISYSGSYNSYILDIGLGGRILSEWQIKKFAIPIKQIASIMTGIPVEKMESQEDKEVVLKEEWWFYVGRYNDIIPYNSKSMRNKEDLVKFTLRQLLQNIGDVMLKIHPDWLLNIMFKYYFSYQEFDTNKIYTGDKWIITDLRKLNEYNKIKELGGKCIKVIKIGQENNDSHISETALDIITDWDYVIEAEHGDIDSLIKQVKEMLIKFKIL